jgi:Fe-Mn family superoxide dismutase
MYNYEAKQFESVSGFDGMSDRLMSEHYKLYEGYIKKANEIMEKLRTVDRATANATYSELRALKLGMSFAIDAIKGHELFFEHLGGQGGQAEGVMAKLIEKSFGSFDAWLVDMKQTGIAARGWVWSAYDWDTGNLLNVLGDGHDAFPIWNATPLVALDVYEHAYFIDYGINRKDYIETFFRKLKWDVIEKRIEDHQIKL